MLLRAELANQNYMHILATKLKHKNVLKICSKAEQDGNFGIPVRHIEKPEMELAKESWLEHVEEWKIRLQSGRVDK